MYILQGLHYLVLIASHGQYSRKVQKSWHYQSGHLHCAQIIWLHDEANFLCICSYSTRENTIASNNNLHRSKVQIHIKWKSYGRQSHFKDVTHCRAHNKEIFLYYDVEQLASYWTLLNRTLISLWTKGTHWNIWFKQGILYSKGELKYCKKRICFSTNFSFLF